MRLSNTSSRLLTGWFIFCLLGLAAAARAHTPGLSTAVVRITPDALNAELVFSIADAAQIVSLDKDGDGKLSQDELAAGVMEMQALASQALEIKVDGAPVKATAARCQFDRDDNASINLTFPTTNFSTLLICSSCLALLPPEHQETFSLQNDKGETLTERMLTASNRCVTIQLNGAESVQPRAPRTPASPVRPSPTRAAIILMALAAVLAFGGVWRLLKRP